MALKPGITFVGLDKIRRAARGWKDDFQPNKRQVKVLFGALGRKVRDDVRKRITTQGDGSWAPLSKWTRARTGRRKALITERSRVTFIVKPNRVEIVYIERSNNWNLTKHHRGFKNSGFSGKKVTIPLRNPGALKVSGNSLTILSAKPSVVPARTVWTPAGKLRRIALPVVNAWARKQLEKRAR